MRLLPSAPNTHILIRDFADAHPEAEVIGTDISPIQPTWVPPNVKLCFFSLSYVPEAGCDRKLTAGFP